MTVHVDPKRFVDKPMLMKELVEGDYLIYADGLVVGWVMCTRPNERSGHLALDDYRSKLRVSQS